MIAVHHPTLRLFALVSAVAIVTGCPGPGTTDVPGGEEGR